MTRRSRALVVFVAAVLVVVACGVSFAQAADRATDVCGPSKGWGPVKTDSQSSSASSVLDLAATPVGFVKWTVPQMLSFTPPDRAEGAAADTLAQPRVPRAPPLV